MNKQKIPNRLKKLTPFFHDIDLGNDFNTAPEIYRMRDTIQLFFPPLLRLFGGNLKGLRVLDVGCNCGGFSFETNKYIPKEIIGIDANENNIKQANAIKKYLKTSNIEFLKLLETLPEEIRNLIPDSILFLSCLLNFIILFISFLGQ